jgi:hypothetical protein
MSASEPLRALENSAASRTPSRGRASCGMAEETPNTGRAGSLFQECISLRSRVEELESDLVRAENAAEN